MVSFERGEAVVLSITIKTPAGVLTDPATSTKITVTDPGGTAVIDAVSMDQDSTGTYHYDYPSADDALEGEYDVLYVAVNNSRTTKHKDKFEIAAA